MTNWPQESLLETCILHMKCYSETLFTTPFIIGKMFIYFLFINPKYKQFLFIWKNNKNKEELLFFY